MTNVKIEQLTIRESKNKKCKRENPKCVFEFFFILNTQPMLIALQSESLYHEQVSKPHISNYLQRKQTCFFANLRVVGYSEAQQDAWQNLWMRTSCFYDIFVFFCNYLFVL